MPSNLPTLAEAMDEAKRSGQQREGWYAPLFESDTFDGKRLGCVWWTFGNRFRFIYIR